MVHDPHVAGHDLVLEDGAGGDVDPLPVVSDDNHRALQTHLDTIDRFYNVQTTVLTKVSN